MPSLVNPPKSLSSRLGVVIEGDTDGASVVAIVLANDLLAVELPEPGIVVGTGRHQVGRIGAERAVPDPALVAREGGLERERLRLLVGGRLKVLDLPDAGGVVGAAGCELLDVGREENARDVLLVRIEVGYRKELGSVVGLEQLPHEYVALFACQFWCRISYLFDNREELTPLFAAQSREPSLATVTLETETSSSGISWWEQLFSARSQTRTLPWRSQLMISPWLGWITTSLAGQPWL